MKFGSLGIYLYICEKFMRPLFVLFFLVIYNSNLFSQNQNKEGYILPKIKPQIEVLKHEVTPGNLSIHYSINFSGMVELRIFNQTNKIVYRDQYIVDKIEKGKPLTIKVSTKKLQAGKYTYALFYKNKDVKSSFIIAN